MSRKITLIFALFIFLTAAFAASSVTDFNINNGATYATSTGVTAYYTITADANCTACLSENSDNSQCTSRSICSSLSSSSAFTLSSSAGSKTVYLFLFDNDSYTTQSSDTITLDSTAPSATVGGVTDGNSYNTNDFTITVDVSDSGSGLDNSTLSFSGAQTFSGNTLTLTDANDGTYTITIDANDLAGNTLNQTVSFTIDTAAPSAGTISFSGWTNSDKPTLTISATHSGGTSGLKMEFSCDNSSWTSWVNYATSYSDFNINSAAYGCSATDWNNSVYVKFKDAAGNVDSNSYRTSVLYDIVAPSAPEDLTATSNNARVTLSWTAPDSDNNSGNKYIAIYKNGTAVKSDLNYQKTTYDVNNLTNGTTYTFKIRTIDAAGNYSDYSNEVSSVPESTSASIAIKRDGELVSYAKKGDVLNVKCAFSPSASDAAIMVKYYNPTTSEEELTSSSSSVSSIDEDFTISSSTTYEKVGFWCTATASSGTSVNYVYLDNTAPVLSWADTNNLFSGIKRVTVNATDNKSFNTVEFDFNNAEYNGIKETTGKYYFDINTMKFENGTYTLEAVGTDNAGNTTTITRTVTLENTQSEKQKATSAISDAKTKKKVADDLVNYYEKEALVVTSELMAKKESADTLLSDANSLFTSGTYATAENKAKSAGSLYAEFNAGVKTTTLETKNYDFDSNTLIDTLKKAGLNETNAARQAQIITASNVKRSLTIVRTGSGDARQVQIDITFTNDTNESVVKIVEIIPKELINSASKIVSSADFRIIQDDPVVEFSVPVAAGATATITYGIGEVTKEAADSLITKNVIGLFSAPPLIVENGIKAEDIVGNNLFGGNLMILVIGILIVVVLIVIAFFVIKIKMPGHGFGEPKSITSRIAPKQNSEKKKWESK